MTEDNKKLLISISTGTILKIVGVFLTLSFIYIVKDIILLIIISIVMAALIEPIVNRLEDKKIPRGGGVLICYVGLLLFAIVVFQLVVPPMVEQVGLMASNFPSFWNRLAENFESVRQVSNDGDFLATIQQNLQGLQSSLTKAAGSAYNFIASLFVNIFNLIIILTVVFYLVVEKNSLSKSLQAISPFKYHGYLNDLSDRIQDKIGKWARGQLLLGLIIGVMSFLGLIFLLPKYALTLALIAGLTELIPYVGPIFGAIPAVFLAFTAGEFSLWRGVAVLILYIIIQQLENNVIVPQVMKKQLGLNPIIIIIAMLIGARFAGIIGIILAVPVATTISIIIQDFISKSDIKGINYKESSVEE